ncbi:MAG: T9SS type A sorting domain-containing protein [Rhizobacter sp.]|nr:T9SS type A sorting domain-containing protein [Chlorobiales bacterium]
MKKIFFCAVLSLYAASLPAQIRVSVSSDKTAYAVGDTVKIRVTTFNDSSSAVTLWWSDGWQASYTIDSVEQYTGGVTLAYTSVTIPASSSATWSDPTSTFPKDRNDLPSGVHKVVGRLLRYGLADNPLSSPPVNLPYTSVSDTLTITVGTSATGNDVQSAMQYTLLQNYPNPFNPNTQITFTLPRPEQVVLKVYDLLGKAVATLVNERRNAGTHTVPFNALQQSSGIYFYKIQAGAFSQTKRMVLLK